MSSFSHWSNNVIDCHHSGFRCLQERPTMHDAPSWDFHAWTYGCVQFDSFIVSSPSDWNTDTKILLCRHLGRAAPSAAPGCSSCEAPCGPHCPQEPDSILFHCSHLVRNMCDRHRVGTAESLWYHWHCSQEHFFWRLDCPKVRDKVTSAERAKQDLITVSSVKAKSTGQSIQINFFKTLATPQ